MTFILLSGCVAALQLLLFLVLRIRGIRREFTAEGCIRAGFAALGAGLMITSVYLWIYFVPEHFAFAEGTKLPVEPFLPAFIGGGLCTLIGIGELIVGFAHRRDAT